jgi:hypothetical protein
VPVLGGGVEVRVGVRDGVAVPVSDAVAVSEAVAVAVRVDVLDGVPVGVAGILGVTVRVGVLVRVLVEVAVRVGVEPDMELRSAMRAGYHLSDIFWLPESLGCTPSYVSVLVSNPVHWSTTIIGDWAVVLPSAQACIWLLKLMTLWGQSGQLPQTAAEGFRGMILATRIFMFGLFARI